VERQIAAQLWQHQHALVRHCGLLQRDERHAGTSARKKMQRKLRHVGISVVYSRCGVVSIAASGDFAMTGLAGKIAIVTGARSGIGLSSAAKLAALGATVVMTGTRQSDIEHSAESLRRQGAAAEGVALDLSQPAAIEAVVHGVLARHGRIDILHNNAADLSLSQQDGDVEGATLEVWDRIFTVNVRGTMWMCKHVLRAMSAQRSGSIINTASALGLQGASAQSAYAASKAAVIQLSRSIATSHGKRGIRCNAVAPGLIDTETARQQLPPPLWNIQLDENLLPYLGRPEDIAEIVAFLAGDGARYITGQTFVADGGSSAHVAGYAQLNALFQKG
jgi:NAD(P)-dependent dehydrogenase (short-subunit alcohol dehydrogenase family)